MAYETEQADVKREVLFGVSAHTFTYYAKVDGKRVEPDASDSFITITDPGGTERVARTAMTKSGTGDAAKLTYALNASDKNVWALNEDYRALVEFEVANVKYQDVFHFDVVRTPIPVLIADNDLADLDPTLSDLLEDVLAAAGQTAQRFILSAHAELMEKIRARGFRPALIVARERLVLPLKHLALFYLYLAASRAPDDVHMERAKLHREMFDNLWAGLGNLRYDSADSTGAGTERNFAQPRFTL